MTEPKPCFRCGRPKPRRKGARTCGQCTTVDAVWPTLKAGPGGCWIWPGRTDDDGYGRYNQFLVHRLTYEALVCEIPAGLTIDHRCLVKRCANPWHLEPVTIAVNTQRRYVDMTHCVNGHPFSDENTRNDRGHRACRACAREASRAYYWRKRVAT